MLRSVILAGVLVGCHRAPAPAPTPCPGPYAITPSTCTAPAPTECRGVCGVVVSRRGCAPVSHATVIIQSLNVAVATDAAGHFDLGPLPAGHYTLRVSAELDTGTLDIDATGGPQTLTAPLELRLADRACGCGGPCPT